ncbi:MAG TPA: hypothetical protein VM936_22260 [Pyrinomonadaceae bacterium]|nr:hypothetical protein [Pyrinomonadaceae bacterium]
MKHAFRLSRAGSFLAVALVLLFGAFAVARAQTLTPTPNSVVFQITNSTIPPTPTPTASPTPTPTATPTPTPGNALNRESFAGDVSGDGRFVVIESSGDISTERSDARNNRDGNQEIFLFDYAQRRIFQITNTTSALKNTAAAAIDPANIDVRVVNLRPVISHDGRWIAFVSNAYSDANGALSPKNFDGNANAAALKLDGNTEIFLYRIPGVAAVDLSTGADVSPVDLASGAIFRVTTTPATALPRAGATNITPFFALDNDEVSINDDGTVIAFVSLAKTGIPGESNAGTNANSEIFIASRSESGDSQTFGYTQVTTTADEPPTSTNPLGTLVFNRSPSLSGSGGLVAFISNADANGEAEADQGNGEIWLANYSGGAVTNRRAITKTPRETRTGFEGISVNLLSPGRRLSRDGKFLAFESTAVYNLNGTLNGALANSTGIYVYDVTAGSFALAASRPPDNQADVGIRFPTFTGDSSRVVFTSNLNYNAEGTVNTSTTEGLNPSRNVQVWSAPVTTLNQLSRVTSFALPGVSAAAAGFSPIQPFVSDTVRRMALTLSANLGFDNADLSLEAFYVLVPVATSETPAASPTPATSPAPVSFFTGASLRAVVAPSPSPTPPDVTGLAPGMLGILRSTLALAPAAREVAAAEASETQRRPPLPVELNGVTVSVSGAAAGLYFVSAGQINFVVPRGLSPGATALPVTIFNNGSVIRTSLVLNSAQPDIFTSTNGPGGRAAALNVTNPCIAPPGEPFPVTTTRPAGSGSGNCTSAETETVPTQLLIMLTGVRGVTSASGVTVRIGTTDIVGTADATSPVTVGPSNTPGFDQIRVTLPASLAGAGDVPVIVTVVTSAGTFTSRPADTAPHITIQ